MAGDRVAFTAQGQLILYDEHDAQIWMSHTMQGADSNETYQLAVVAECAYIANSKMYVSWITDTDGCDAYPVTGSYIACAALFAMRCYTFVLYNRRLIVAMDCVFVDRLSIAVRRRHCRLSRRLRRKL